MRSYNCFSGNKAMRSAINDRKQKFTNTWLNTDQQCIKEWIRKEFRIKKFTEEVHTTFWTSRRITNDNSVENIPSEKPKEENENKNNNKKNRPRDMWDSIKFSNTWGKSQKSRWKKKGRNTIWRNDGYKLLHFMKQLAYSEFS